MSDATPILHILTPQRHVSPFDVGMAVDAGFKVVVPYTGVTLGEVRGLVQDAMFSRAAADGARTGILIGGRDVLLALDMLDAARAALLPPFQLSLLADPAGAFTAAAATIALIEQALRAKLGRDWPDVPVAVLGATGVVGLTIAILAAQQGARVRILAHRRVERLAAAAEIAARRLGVRLEPGDGSSVGSTLAALADVEIVISAATAGARVLDAQHLAGAHRLLLAADLNAVPPSGIEGIEPYASGEPIGAGRVLGIGPLAIGEIKNAVEAGLLRRMAEAGLAVHLDLCAALALARRLVDRGGCAQPAGT